MAWVKVDDKFSRGRKVKRAARILGGRNARARILAVWLDAMSYCNLNLTDGLLPDDEIDTLPDNNPQEVFDAMAQGDEDLGAIVERTPKGWVFRNYGEYQPLKADVEAKLEKDRKRKRLNSDSTKPPRGGIMDSGHTDPNRTDPTEPTDPIPDLSDPTDPTKEDSSIQTPAKPFRPNRPTQDSLCSDRLRHLNCIGSGNWYSCIRGRCVPSKMVKDWQAQGFSEDYCQKVIESYLERIPEGTALPSDAFKLWGGVWDEAHQAHDLIPKPPTGGRDSIGTHNAKVLQRVWAERERQQPQRPTRAIAGGDQ
jgi:hypothetical protein